MAIIGSYTGHISTKRAIDMHSININGYNTWDDWHLIPSSRPVINPPNKKVSEYDVPGSNGLMDESDSVRKFPIYSIREGQWSFYVANDYGNWQSRYTEILDAIHGLHATVVLDDDPSWYYTGTLSVDEWQSNKDRSTIIINYRLYPYKLQFMSSTNEDWLWDPFNFETDWIYSDPGLGLNKLFLPTETANTWIALSFSNGYFGRLPISPKIIVSYTDNNGIRLKLNNPELEIKSEDFYEMDGTTRIDGIKVENTKGIRIANFTLSNIKNSNTVTIYLKGTGLITFDFRVGRL